MDQFVAWLAPILSALITGGGMALINSKLASGERKRDAARAETEAKRAVEAAWRDSVSARLDEQDERIGTILQAQCSQMRSDILHKAHRYIDDLGCASTEEKQAMWAEYEDYETICDANNITNHFIDKLVNQVMSLPNRDENR